MGKLSAVQIVGKRGNWLDLARARNAYYERDKKRNGPVVGYAGKYTASDGRQRQWVGNAYINFAIIEEDAADLEDVGSNLALKTRDTLNPLPKRVVALGAPIGGYWLTVPFARGLGCRMIKAEKKVKEVGVGGKRDKTVLILDRHDLNEGDQVIIVEDVCNNFSTTLELIKLVESYGATVIAIVCYLNRSLDYDSVYNPPGTDYKVPIIWLAREKIPEYEQDDPEVVDAVKAGNVVWKPKKKEDWARLMRLTKNQNPGVAEAT